MGKIEILKKRSEILKAVREFFFDQGFFEVETQIRSPQALPEANIELFKSENNYLQSSPEQYMKRLLASGSGDIFQINKAFRKNERGYLHLPEFTMLEWYRVGGDYLDLMKDCQALVFYILKKVDLPKSIKKYFLDAKWENLTLAQAFAKFTQSDSKKASKEGEFDFILVDQIEPNLGQNQPCFLIDYPIEQASLAKAKKTDSGLAERFELYVKGIELANGFSELLESEIQRERFCKERSHSKALLEMPMPEAFLKDIAKITKASGIALGLDRLVMVLLELKSIDQVVAFTPEDL
ncbi:MAG: EF-P lysine aminoacylase EpmA [SAR324 cluster bacterium]|nr:EF-P lysine aminoacylase EpmA [SAR324 cluster bacterium]